MKANQCSDKHEYNTVAQKKHPISCLLTPESKLIKRIPDATFGLATFQPRDYQNCLADWDLDRERLESLALHRHCGLLSDPHWGDASLVFPFAVYEAKGWSGDACEARRQATSAGAVYLDLLDRLTRQPGKLGDKEGTYQTGKSRNSQVFAFTSFGAHWHILVGYKRPRLKREFRGYDGVSDSVYVSLYYVSITDHVLTRCNAAIPENLERQGHDRTKSMGVLVFRGPNSSLGSNRLQRLRDPALEAMA